MLLELFLHLCSYISIVLVLIVDELWTMEASAAADASSTILLLYIDDSAKKKPPKNSLYSSESSFVLGFGDEVSDYEFNFFAMTVQNLLYHAVSDRFRISCTLGEAS